MGWITKLFTGSEKPIIEQVADVADRFVDTKDDKRKFFLEVYDKQVQEKNAARSLYKADARVQKIYALTFLAAYLGLTAWLIYLIASGSIKEVNQFETGLLGTIWGAMSAKVNTITDFFFGSSDNGEKNTQFK